MTTTLPLYAAGTIAALAFGMSSAHQQPGSIQEPADDTRRAADALAEPFRVLVFSKTAGFRHASIPDGIACVTNLAEQNGFRAEAIEDAAAFNDDNLARFRVIIFLNTTKDVLNEDQQGAMERFVRAGGGFVGVHAAADTEYDWPWYGQLVGAWFSRHPHIQQADIEVIDRTHHATAHLPAVWTRTDEWYDYRTQPGAIPGFETKVRVLMRMDTDSYDGDEMGDPHPIAWCQLFDGGRSFYTGGGHTSQSYTDPAFTRHLLGGILWAAGREPPKP